MKVAILAGGFGTRLSEETTKIPKPMVEIGGKPILWHIMKLYSYYGFNDFIICLGYKGYIIKEYFLNYFYHMSDITIDLSDGGVKIHNTYAENWKITLVDTGLNTMTGGRIKKIKKYIGNETFMLTYGDGVGNINIKELADFHKKHGKLSTLTAVQPSGRFGALTLNEKNEIKQFIEKPAGDGAWINGGFFVLEPGIFDYIKDDTTIWEREPLEKLADEGNLYAYKHYGFWKPMDTLRDKNELERLWQEGNAPWKIWE
ncbi:glucose-1-phosphate cytidylyltransferase [Marinitoga hydrogenitolerans DSM 16785]|uniref:Glucose-1-phosphate cytidylyltransferase n=1 Tax=Marinitoga hydrogenitolerans (strain DSM 16785 / JCM 12826 / AT1271) TaxID=1122195 RepID=A0A1M4ZCG9_MARH1|nr:glucose-1-phosphate cytidylyltransferase [Marinitoga hydrogenitolerans]SHF15711.1 glucose-1-phosphate cytidylyltransferase [Marinitoga hydrogenitolerans DSM 16785]